MENRKIQNSKIRSSLFDSLRPFGRLPVRQKKPEPEGLASREPDGDNANRDNLRLKITMKRRDAVEKYSR